MGNSEKLDVRWSFWAKNGSTKVIWALAYADYVSKIFRNVFLFIFTDGKCALKKNIRKFISYRFTALQNNFEIKNHKKCFNTARSVCPYIGLSNKSNKCFYWSANEKLRYRFGSEATAEQIVGS